MKFHVTLEKDVCRHVISYETGRTALTAGEGTSVCSADLIVEDDACHVVLGRDSVVSYEVSFVFSSISRNTYAENYLFGSVKERSLEPREIVIGNEVYIGARAMIMEGVQIDDGAIVLPGSVVMEPVPSYAVVAGNPAQIICCRVDDNTIKSPVIDADTQRKLDEFQEECQQFLRMIGCNIRNGYIEKVLSDLSYLAMQIYNPSQYFTDDVMESYLSELLDHLPCPSYTPRNHDRRRIVFYDGFGLDTRGLSLIYLRALSKMDVDVLLITVEQAFGNIPMIEKTLKRCSGRIHYLSNESNPSYIDYYQDICQAITDFCPDVGFLCTTPWDISAILAFMQMSGKMKRYQINLTDHAFWLGRQAFDFCLEFRDFGANVSRIHRNIPMRKILKQPYYPFVDEDISFAGFPFEKEEGDFVIFSGGTCYKTIDRENSYYRIVDFCLHEFPHTKFWYAGTVNIESHANPLIELAKKYRGRGFCSDERSDLLQILQHVDMYLNTCPQIGGLMTQYSVLAGRPPITFRCLPKSAGAESVLLPHTEPLGIEFTDMNKLFSEIKRFIGDPVYRSGKEACMNAMKLVVTEDEFAENLKRIIWEDQSNYDISWFAVDMSTQKALYAYIWAKMVN